MADDDAELVALIDDELDESAKGRLLARLAEDAGLRERYQALREAGAPVAASFDALLQRAPLSRLRAALPPERPPRSAANRLFAGIALRELAAGIVIGLLAAGAAAWVALSLAPPSEQDDWRSAVSEYMELYTNETFSFANLDPSFQAKTLSCGRRQGRSGVDPGKRGAAGPAPKIGAHSLL